MVSPRRLAAALSSLSVPASGAGQALSMLVVVMSLPPVMKKRDRPLVGDSPARIRVPMVGTVSLGGVVAAANGRCGIPESSPGRPLCKAVCGASPRNQVRGRLRRASGTGPTPGRSRGEDLCPMRVGLGEEGWKPAGERAEEAATPVRGAAWWNGAPVRAVARRRRPGVQAGH